MVKNLPAMQETQVQSLGWEDPLEKEMATHSSNLACEIPWTEEPGRLQSMQSQRVGHDLATNTLEKKKKKNLADIYVLARQKVKAHLNSPLSTSTGHTTCMIF